VGARRAHPPMPVASEASFGRAPLQDPDHPEVQRLRRLHARPERDRTGLFFTEGTRFIIQALQTAAPVQRLFYAPERLEPAVSQHLIHGAAAQGIPCLPLAPEVFLSLSLAKEPQWVGAVVRQRWETLRQIRPSGSLGWVCLETIDSPGNLGTILRTSAAVGAAGVILLGDRIDPYDPAAVRATMGALFSQRLVRADFSAFSVWRGAHKPLLVGTSPSARTDYRAVRYDRPTVLFMGSEKRGLSPEQQALCDVVVKIPMVGAVDSLNVAVATGVLLYEVFDQQRRRSGGAAGRRRRSR
jgi:TrmH family RNA methyltransferase